MAGGDDEEKHRFPECGEILSQPHLFGSVVPGKCLFFVTQKID